MFCTKCGRELPDGIEICPTCNDSVEPIEQAENNPIVSKDTIPATKMPKPPLYISIIASIILIIAMLVPFISITIFGTKVDSSLIKGDGVLFIAIAVISLLLSFIRKHIGVIIMGIIAIALSIFETYNMTHIKNDSEYDWLDYSALIHKEIGFYLMFLGSILILTAGIYELIIKKKNSKVSSN